MSMSVKAFTGHNGEDGRDGILSILMELFICMVFDNFSSIWAPGWQEEYVHLSQLLKWIIFSYGMWY